MDKFTEKDILEFLKHKKLENKRPKFSKLIVSLIIFMNVVFTSGVLYVFLKTGSEPMTLIGCFFAFTTGELWMLSSIKRKEVDFDGECED